MRIKNMLYPVLISAHRIPELRQISCLQDGVQIGASVTLTDLLSLLETQVDKLPGTYIEYINLIDSTKC